MLGSIISFAIWLLLVVSLIVVGWEEPLRYKFTSSEQIKQEEKVFQPTPTPPPKKPDYQKWSKSPSLLETDPRKPHKGLELSK